MGKSSNMVYGEGKWYQLGLWPLMSDLCRGWRLDISQWDANHVCVTEPH